MISLPYYQVLKKYLADHLPAIKKIRLYTGQSEASYPVSKDLPEMFVELGPGRHVRRLEMCEGCTLLANSSHRPQYFFRFLKLFVRLEFSYAFGLKAYYVFFIFEGFFFQLYCIFLHGQHLILQGN